MNKALVLDHGVDAGPWWSGRGLADRRDLLGASSLLVFTVAVVYEAQLQVPTVVESINR